MAVLDITQYPNPVLLEKTQPVPSIGAREKILVQDMIDTMHSARGVGLAANQIGLNLRLFVASDDGVRGKELVFFNPEIIKKSGRLYEFEGCLSVCDIYEPVKRYKNVTLRGTNLKGEVVEKEATGLLSRIFQHEMDHLNGKVFVHRLGCLKRKRIFKKLDQMVQDK